MGCPRAKHFWFSFTGQRTTVDADIHDAVKVKSYHDFFFLCGTMTFTNCKFSQLIEVFTFVLSGQST